MTIESKVRLPSNPISASRLRMTMIEAAKKRQLERLLPRSTNTLQRQPPPVTPDELEPKIEKNITGEEARALISGYSPEVLHRWQQSIVEKSSMKTVIDDRYLFFKLRAQFFRLNSRMPELKDLIEMNDQTLEEMMGGSKKKEETMVLRQSMVRHNVLPSDSQIVFHIDLLGLPEGTREILIDHNIKTIESICQIVGKELESDEKTIRVNRFIKNQLLKFIQELAEREKTSSSPEGLPTSLKQSGPPILEEKQRRTVEKPKRSKGKKQADIYQKADIYREAKQAGLLIKLTSNQQASLELVFGQELTISEAARRLSVERNKTVPHQSVRQYIIGALKRLKKLKSSPEKELTGLAYLQVMFPGRLGTITYNTLKKKKNINTIEELKSILPNIDLTGIGPKGIQACVDLLKHFFPDDDQIINLPEQAIEPLP